MSAVLDVSLYLIRTLTFFYVTLILLRFLMQIARADFYNPISQFIVKATNPPLLPLRRLIPGVWGLDMAALVLAIAVQMAAIALVLFLYGGALQPAKIFTWALLNCIGLVGKIYFFSIIIVIVLSWIAPYSNHPAAVLVMQINEPVMRPLRRLLPPMGGFDFSPLLAFVILQVVKILLSHAAVASGMYAIVSFGV